MEQLKDHRPPDYQESIACDICFELMHRLKVMTPKAPSRPSREVNGEEVKLVYAALHPALRLLLSSSKKNNHARTELEILLLKESQGELTDGERRRLTNVINNPEKCEMGDNMEIDVYLAGFADRLRPVINFSSSLHGSEVRVIGVGEPASPSSSCRLPHIPVDEKITSNAKIKSNALYIVEVASRGGSIVKKLAQLERDAHYALLRAKSTDVRDIIGFAVVSMMEKKSFQVATIIIQSHPQIFKLLYALVQARALAYFFNERTMYKDVSNLMHSMDTVVSKLGRLETKLGRLETMVSKLGRLETMVLIGFVAIGCLLLRNKH